MKFSAREDIDAPLSVVYDHLRDFDRFERQMLRRGIDVRRDETCPAGEVGARWQADVEWKGKPYTVQAELVSIEPDQGYAVELASKGITGLLVVDTVALSKSRTRLFASLDLKGEGFAARMLLQSMRLAKGRLDQGFAERLHRVAQSIPTV